jgi:ubiquinone/menaquinone biosynthesis C-methylase UbiE
MLQKNIFLESEADAWFQRNHTAVTQRDYSLNDSLTSSIVGLTQTPSLLSREVIKILEVGCGEGRRLEWLAKNTCVEVYGIEPSQKAVDLAASRGVNVKRSTADALLFEDAKFDIVIFGFCLYLCDRKDLFRIAEEADRVLKDDSWLVIQDFYSRVPIEKEYHHFPGMKSYKMDYKTLFDWHPNYTCYSHNVHQHSSTEFTDDRSEWVSTSVLRKLS